MAYNNNNNNTAMNFRPSFIPNYFTLRALRDGHLKPEHIHPGRIGELHEAILWEVEKERARQEIIAMEIERLRRNQFPYVPPSSTVRFEPPFRYPVAEEYRGIPAEQRWHTIPAASGEPRARFSMGELSFEERVARWPHPGRGI